MQQKITTIGEGKGRGRGKEWKGKGGGKEGKGKGREGARVAPTETAGLDPPLVWNAHDDGVRRHKKFS